MSPFKGCSWVGCTHSSRPGWPWSSASCGWSTWRTATSASSPRSSRLFLLDSFDLGVFWASLAAIAIMFGIGYVLQRGLLNFTIGTDDTRPILVTFGLSIIIQNGLVMWFSADSARPRRGPHRERQRPHHGTARDRLVPADRLRHRRRGHRGAPAVPRQDQAGPRFPGHLRRSGSRRAHGHRQPSHLRLGHGHRSGHRRTRRHPACDPHHVRPEPRSVSPHLRLRGGHHGRHGLDLGDARRRHRPRRLADRGRPGLRRRLGHLGRATSCSSPSSPSNRAASSRRR